ncbi:MAG: hypothetical protein HY313_10500 [Acidobacteria bacterium]|nr:hypothetical protein [Acidobacteriota bacterium]
MRRSGFIFLVLLGLPVLGVAQEEGPSPLRAYLSYGNSFRGFPGNAGKHQFATGGELVLWKGFGAGLELGARGLSLNTSDANQELTCTQSGTSSGSGAPVFSCRESSGPGAFTLSANGSYNFPLGQFEPFVTAGYSLSAFKDNSTFHFMNYGGGINYWFNSSTGLRLEVRDHLSLRNRQDHFPEFRVGMIFDFH